MRRVHAGAFSASPSATSAITGARKLVWCQSATVEPKGRPSRCGIIPPTMTTATPFM